MGLTGIFDRLFLNQLLYTNERGETTFFPNGPTGRGYLVPAAREAGFRARVRMLVLLALGVAPALILLVHAIEAWLGYEVPMPWFIGGTVAMGVVGAVAIIRALARLTDGLEPAAARP